MGVIKQCTKCNAFKALDEFYKGRHDCKTCRCSYNRSRYHKQRDRIRILKREYYYRHRKKIIGNSRRNNLRAKYNLTLEEVDAMILAQRGLCAICKRPPGGTGSNAILHVDHNHCNGKVRQMLCHKCNIALGMVDDNPNILQSMIHYLEHSI